MSAGCPIAYDHVGVDECEVCGLTAGADSTPAHGPRDMDSLTGPKKIEEAIARLSGAYAPTEHVILCDREGGAS